MHLGDIGAAVAAGASPDGPMAAGREAARATMRCDEHRPAYAAPDSCRRRARRAALGLSDFGLDNDERMDNDVYGHINNVVYYSYFDTW